MKRLIIATLFCVAALLGAAQTAILSCDAPTGLHASDVGLDHITITWDEDPDVSNWQVWYYPNQSHASPTESSTTTSTGSYTFHYTYIEVGGSHGGLVLPLVWDFAVRADCGDSTWSAWSNIITVALPYVGIEEQLLKAIRLYPNPTTSHVNIRADGDVSVKRLEVYDVYGKVVRTVVGANNDSFPQTQIDVSDLSPGMYFVRVSTDLGPITKPFVIK